MNKTLRPHLQSRIFSIRTCLMLLETSSEPMEKSSLLPRTLHLSSPMLLQAKYQKDVLIQEIRHKACLQHSLHFMWESHLVNLQIKLQAVQSQQFKCSTPGISQSPLSNNHHYYFKWRQIYLKTSVCITESFHP